MRFVNSLFFVLALSLLVGCANKKEKKTIQLMPNCEKFLRIDNFSDIQKKIRY